MVELKQMVEDMRDAYVDGEQGRIKTILGPSRLCRRGNTVEL